MEITFGDVIVNNHWTIDEIRDALVRQGPCARVVQLPLTSACPQETAITENPWPGMQPQKLNSMLNTCMEDLLPFVEKMSAEVNKK
jgi:hypothetical protein